MVQTLLIRLLPEGASEWLALGRDGRARGEPEPGLPREKAEHVCVLVPSEDVLLLRAPCVARQRRQLELAVPFAIEDQLAAPVEQSHVALAGSARGDHIDVAVVAHARIEAWLAQLRAADIEPDRMLPEGLLLPLEEGGATVLADGDRLVLRHAAAGMLAGGRGELASWLGLLAADARAPARLHWIGPSPAQDADLSLRHEATTSTLLWFASRLPRVGGEAIDLLQGRHAARRSRAGAQRLWRWAAALATLALLAAFAQLALERHQLESRHAAQRAEMEQLLRSAAPDLTRIVDPKAQLSAEFARIGRTQGGSGALPLLAQIAPSIAGSGRYTIDGIEFRGDSLELIILGADIAALDSLRETLSALSLQVELTSANPGTGGVEGRLRIRSGGA